jgi:hypothetical protein
MFYWNGKDRGRHVDNRTRAQGLTPIVDALGGVRANTPVGVSHDPLTLQPTMSSMWGESS